MGGNALKKTVTRRYLAEEYYVLVEQALSELQAKAPGAEMDDVKAYREKASFGDLDVVVKNVEGTKQQFAQALVELGVTEVVKNGNVWSCGWGDFQLDLLFQQPKDYEFALRYFAWNDLGNLLGRTAHKAGFKFGHNGLKVVLRDGDYVVKELLVTSDFGQALQFLGFDPSRYEEGFDTLEEVFQYASSTPFFAVDAFLLENRSYKARVRDAKRPTYNAFLAWAEKLDFPAPVKREKSEWLREACLEFPEFAVELDAVKQSHAKSKEAKLKFNGGMVSQLTGLTEKQLGELMKHLRKDAESKGGLVDFVLAQSPSDLERWVLDVAKEHLSEWHNRDSGPTIYRAT